MIANDYKFIQIIKKNVLVLKVCQTFNHKWPKNIIIATLLLV